MTVDPPWRLDPHQNIVGVGWSQGSLLVLPFVYFTETGDTNYDLCTIDCPTGPGTSDKVTFPIFSSINQIPSSDHLAGVGSGIYTAKNVIDLTFTYPIRSPGTVAFDERYIFQTLFIAPKSYYADSAGIITFKINIPSMNWQVAYTPWIVVWGTSRTDTPSDWTVSEYGVDVFDQQRFYRDGGATDYSGSIFETEAAARAFLGTAQIYYNYFSMPVGVSLLGTSLWASAGNYTAKTIGGPDGAGGALPGPLDFPLDTPEVVTDAFGIPSISPAGENITYDATNYAIGFYTPSHPWPDYQYWDVAVGAASNYPDPIGPQTIDLKIDTSNNAIIWHD